MPIEELPEIGFTDPGIDAAADLDAERLRHGPRASQPARGIDLAIPALTDQTIDPIRQAGFSARQRITAREDRIAQARPGAARACASGGVGTVGHRTAGYLNRVPCLTTTSTRCSKLI